MAKARYLQFFKQPHISIETDIPDSRKGTIAYIESDRFTATSLYSKATKFDEFDDSIKVLYKTTFGDSAVVEKYASGKAATPEQFFARIQGQSSRWEKGYLFSAFIINDNESDDVVGYEVIGNATDANDKFIDNTGEAAYLFNKAYHRGGEKGLKYVGYECSGALFLEYGERLYKGKEFVNQIFNKDKEKFEGGTVFAKIQATSRTDNPGSEHILRNLGCKEIEINQKFGHERFLFEKDLSLDDSSVIPDGISTEMLGLNIDSSSD